MCTDSMVTLHSYSTYPPLVTTFENAQKLIELGKDLPAAAMINGTGDVGGRLVGHLLKSASNALDIGTFPATPDGVVQCVEQTITPLYVAQIPTWKQNAAAFYNAPERLAEVNADRRGRGLAELDHIAPEMIGIQHDAVNSPPDAVVIIDAPHVTVIVASFFLTPSAVSIEWPGPRITDVVPGLGSPLSWWGSGGAPIERLVRGFDLGRLSSLGDHDAKQVFDYAMRPEIAISFAMPTPIPAMPLQDAIDFTEYLGQVSCGYDKFTAGPPSVGGDLDVLVLTTGSREWIREKRIHSSLPKRH